MIGPVDLGVRSSASAMSSSSLRDHTCVVTGASSGIGRAIALALWLAGATVCAVVRRTDDLETATSQRSDVGRFELYRADLAVDEQVAGLAKAVLALESGVDVLVHGAGTICVGDLETASVDDLDRQYAANVRAPNLLTKALLPALRANEGQIVFINSTAGLAARAGVAHYAATKHALKAMADSLREEVNPDGVRVMSVYPGRTATPLQATLHAIEETPYRPDRLVQPEDIASIVLNTLRLPRTAEVTDVMVRPMIKPGAQ